MTRARLGSPADRADFFASWTRENAAAQPGSEPRPRRTSRATRLGVAALLVAGSITSVVLPASSALADPSAHTWHRLRECESGNHYDENTGNDHYGAYQFDLATWHSVGGHGYPNRASKAEQDYRALILYRERGWEPWQCASILGLREDSDAGSGHISDINAPGSGMGGSGSGGGDTSGRNSGGVPDFPGGSHWYHYGENNSHIKRFQNAMHDRGYFPAGTGQYGPKTRRMVKQLQRLNGLIPNGYIGPNTWRLAWKGRYSTPGTGSTPSVPQWPGGDHYYSYGENNRHIKAFQDEMHRRGYFPAGTGQFGPKTLRMVKQLQRLNGLGVVGFIGPNTWRLAWVGRYHR